MLDRLIRKGRRLGRVGRRIVTTAGGAPCCCDDVITPIDPPPSSGLCCPGGVSTWAAGFTPGPSNNARAIVNLVWDVRWIQFDGTVMFDFQGSADLSRFFDVDPGSPCTGVATGEVEIGKGLFGSTLAMNWTVEVNIQDPATGSVQPRECTGTQEFCQGTFGCLPEFACGMDLTLGGGPVAGVVWNRGIAGVCPSIGAIGAITLFSDFDSYSGGAVGPIVRGINGMTSTSWHCGADQSASSSSSESMVLARFGMDVRVRELTDCSGESGGLIPPGPDARCDRCTEPILAIGQRCTNCGFCPGCGGG